MIARTFFQRFNRSQYLIGAGMVAISLAVSAAVTIFLPYGIDWHEAFRPASLAILSGQTPYTIEKYYAAPWGLLPLLPLALLPESWGRGVLFTISLISLSYIAYRLKAKPLAAAAFLLSPPVIHGLLNANIDWLAMLGFILPPQIGLLFIVIKPQIGIGMVVYWLVECWRIGRLAQVARVFWPTAIISLVSFALFGFWPLRFTGITEYSQDFNASLWPASLPIGLALLAAAVHKREPRYALASSPCLSPHVVFHSYAGALAALLPATGEMIAAVLGLWILVILRGFAGS